MPCAAILYPKNRTPIPVFSANPNPTNRGIVAVFSTVHTMLFKVFHMSEFYKSKCFTDTFVSNIQTVLHESHTKERMSTNKILFSYGHKSNEIPDEKPFVVCIQPTAIYLKFI